MYRVHLMAAQALHLSRQTPEDRSIRAILVHGPQRSLLPPGTPAGDHGLLAHPCQQSVQQAPPYSLSRDDTAQGQTIPWYYAGPTWNGAPRQVPPPDCDMA